MKDTILKVAAAGLLHDIGKFAGRGVLDVSEEYYNNNADIYLPFRDGAFTHHHALYTAAFVETLEGILPPEFNAHQWGEGDSLINLAAGHHNPQTPMQWIMAVADRASAGWDRDSEENQEEKPSSGMHFMRVRMVPLFEQISLLSNKGFESASDFELAYPLGQLSLTSIFPRPAKETVPSGLDTARREYRDLFFSFKEKLEGLLHRNDVPLWLEHFDSLLMRYTGSIPSDRSGKVIPDVSLYDHSKMTAAIAVALYRYHSDTSSMTEVTVRDAKVRKLLFVSGDFKGIQSFIFDGHGIAAKYRSKILRGRSLAVSILSELAADLICRTIGLPTISVVLNAAGKFTILAPNTEGTREALVIAEEKINDWMFEASLGRTMMAFSTVEACCDDFVEGRFPELWDAIWTGMAENKFRGFNLARYGGCVEGYLDSFDEDPPLCSLCGRRPASGDAVKSRYLSDAEGGCCTICRDHVFLGANVVKNPRIYILDAKESKGDGRENRLFKPIFGDYQVRFSSENGDEDEPPNTARLLRAWTISSKEDDFFSSRVTVKPLAGHVPQYGPGDHLDERILHGDRRDERTIELIDMIREGDPKSLHHIANMALNPCIEGPDFQGVAALGVLRADVDNLGLLMSCGLKRNRLTVSRLATLSRQLDTFFTLFLPNLLMTEEEYRDTYTVFTGGDDVFLMGPWNRIVDLAARIRKEFAFYVCGNREISISAGISLHKPHTPVDAMARSSERALEASKATQEKNKLTLFDETVTWQEEGDLKEVRNNMEQWLDQGRLSRVMFYRLNDYIRMSAAEASLQELDVVPFSLMECTKWRALLSYAVERNVGSGLKSEERRRVVKEIREHLASWLVTYRGKLRIPVWSALYDRR